MIEESCNFLVIFALLFFKQTLALMFCDSNCQVAGSYCVADDPTAFSVCRHGIRLGTWHCSSGFLWDINKKACNWPMSVPDPQCPCLPPKPRNKTMTTTMKTTTSRIATTVTGTTTVHEIIVTLDADVDYSDSQPDYAEPTQRNAPLEDGNEFILPNQATETIPPMPRRQITSKTEIAATTLRPEQLNASRLLTSAVRHGTTPNRGRHQQPSFTNSYSSGSNSAEFGHPFSSLFGDRSSEKTVKADIGDGTPFGGAKRPISIGGGSSGSRSSASRVTIATLLSSSRHNLLTCNLLCSPLHILSALTSLILSCLLTLL